MSVGFNKVYPRPPAPLTPDTVARFPFYLDSRREFFETSWKEGAFEEGSVTMLLAPRIFGKTSFLNMLPQFLTQKRDDRTVYSYSCMDAEKLNEIQVVVGEMLKGGENRILVLDEMNYAIGREPLWKSIAKLAGNISQMKGRRQTIILTTSETSSMTVKEAFDVLHPQTSRLPALNKRQTKTVASGVLKTVTGKKEVPRKLLDLIWAMSGGIPPYIRISLSQVLRSLGKPVDDNKLLGACMFDFFDNLDTVTSCIQTLTNCPIETAKMPEKDLVLMADQFCLSCPIECRKPSIKQPVIATDLAQRYGLVFTANAIASPIAFYYNDYLGRKRFEEFSSDIANRERAIRTYIETYGKKEFINDILILLEIALQDITILERELDPKRLFEFFQSKAELIFLGRTPAVATLINWVKDFTNVCKRTVYGDKGIDLAIHNLRLFAGMSAINSYVQCKNWKTKMDLKSVAIFHKFEMVLRTAKQIHAAILISTSEIDEGLLEEAKSLTKENKTVFSCWSARELTTILSAACGKSEEVRKAIEKLSTAELTTKIKGGALEFLTLRIFSILAERVTQQ